MSNKLDAPGDVIHSLYGRCPSCSISLEGSVECKLETHQGGGAAETPAPSKAELRPVIFQRASSFMRFSLDLLPLDRLLQPLEPGNLVMLRGQGASVIAELLAFRAQLPRERGGLDSRTLFIDGGNCSDPYLLASFAKRYQLDTRKALRRVTSCRVFTAYQLASLLSNGVAEMAETYGSKLVIMADLLGTFNEPESNQNEVNRLLDAIHFGIAEAKGKLVVIATLGSPNRYDEVVCGWSDTLVDFSPRRGGKIQAELLRHPTKKPESSEFTISQLFHPDSPLELVH